MSKSSRRTPFRLGPALKDTVGLLAKEERDEIAKIAEIVVTSFTTVGCVPLGEIRVIGHADKDFHGVEFGETVSDEIAKSVAVALNEGVNARQ